jgi:tRNA threonylcarbamoyl adenosine modification protein YeaZ
VLVLAIDTATPAVTAGVVEVPARGGPAVLAQRVTVDPRAHVELLSSHVKQALADAGHTLSTVDAIVCGVGPGPFTGLRVGMVTAAAFGHALDVPVYGVCSLDALAWDVTVEGPVLVATDARRREVYWARYGEAGRRTDGPHVQRPADLAARLGELDVGHAAGAGARLYADVLGLPVVPPDHPTVHGLAAAAAGALRGGDEPARLVPMYLRRPDAVEPGARKPVLASRDVP